LAGSGLPTNALSLLFSQKPQSKISVSLDLLAPPYRAASWQQHPGDVSFQNLVSELSVKPTVIRLRSKSVSIFANYILVIILKGQKTKTLYAYLPLLPAVKTSQPQEIISSLKSERLDVCFLVGIQSCNNANINY